MKILKLILCKLKSTEIKLNNILPIDPRMVGFLKVIIGFVVVQ